MNEDPGESFVIETLTRSTRPVPGWLLHGPGDDAALFQDGSALTVDAMVEGVHFKPDAKPADVGAKLAAVNASDLAATGATPVWGLLTLSLPNPLDESWVEGFAGGLLQALSEMDAHLVGGDTTRSPGPIHASLSMGGKVSGNALTRAGSSPGEDVWVSGVLGDAAAAFSHPDAPSWVHSALVRPEPPLRLGPALSADGLATAAMDLSDGLGRDLSRLCAASGCGAVIDPKRLPCSSWLSENVADPVPYQVGFGEDYQLLFTAQKAHREDILRLGEHLGLQLTQIGRTVCGGGARLTGRDWPPVWTHFSEKA
ncbi:MAG: thiamine-phosphate kinase [Myxococcota bacterium]|nr:thiamine-phosphate kinase [Myxococcota bacterium]